jgi:3-dehydroquinate synthase class II
MLQVKKLAAYIDTRSSQGTATLDYETATVTRVTPVGMGDRVCVDLCSMMAPGEGLLVGSFSRALFLVHSECMESAYINSRPFRVNAGAVSTR